MAQKPHDVCTLTVHLAQLAYKLAVYQHTRTYAGKHDGELKIRQADFKFSRELHFR